MTPPGETPRAFWPSRTLNAVVHARAGIMSGGMIGATPSAISWDDFFQGEMMRSDWDVSGVGGPITYSIGAARGPDQIFVFCTMFAGRINEDAMLATQSSDFSRPISLLLSPWAPSGQWSDIVFGVPAAGMLSVPDAAPGLPTGIDGNRITWNETAWSVSVDDPTWGHGLTMYALWHPQAKFIDGDPSETSIAVGEYQPSTSKVRPALVGRAAFGDSYTMAQWPYGVDGGLWEPDWRFNTQRVTSKPCWILSNKIAPLPASDTTVTASSGSTSGSITNNNLTGPCIAECALMWFMPEAGEHYSHHYYADWFDIAPQAVDASASFFLGTPQFIDPNKWGHALDGYGDGSHEQYAQKWLGSYFNNEEMTIFSPGYPHTEEGFKYPTRGFPGFVWAAGTATSGSAAQGLPAWSYNEGATPVGSTSDPFYSPHIKIDAEFRLPFIEFARSAVWDALAGGTVIEAMAEVFFGGTARVEFNAEGTFYPTGWGSLSTEEKGAYAGSKVGWTIEQASTETPGSVADTREEYVMVQRLYQEVQGDASLEYESDNSHVWVDDYMQEVQDATATAPEMWIESGYYKYPPAYVPRQEPWYPSTSVHAPNPVTALEGLRVDFALIGMQPHHQVFGITEREIARRTTKEMERNLIWHHANNPYEAFAFTPDRDYDESGPFPFDEIYPRDGLDRRIFSHFGYASDIDYLEFLRAQDEVPEEVGTLADYRFRHLVQSTPNPDSANGRIQRVLADTWETINLREVFQAIVNDVPRTRLNENGDEFTFRHTRYRICPCGPRPPATMMRALSGGDDPEPTNISGLFGTMLPDIGFPVGVSGAAVDCSDEFWRITYDGINYQKFESFEMRNVVVRVRRPDGRVAIVRIRTPWDA